jgi:hypothetical protein
VSVFFFKSPEPNQPCFTLFHFQAKEFHSLLQMVVEVTASLLY